MERLTLTERLEIESGYEILEDFFNLLVENYDFEYEEDVYGTISYLNEESIAELYSFLYEGYELSDYFFEDLEKSFAATQSFLAEANSYIDFDYLAESLVKKLKRVGQYVTGNPKERKLMAMARETKKRWEDPELKKRSAVSAYGDFTSAKNLAREIQGRDTMRPTTSSLSGFGFKGNRFGRLTPGIKK